MSPRRRSGLHGHEHAHPDAGKHAHPHHHAGESLAHAHAHTLAFERFAYACSPVHDLDPRAKIVASAIAVLAVVATPPVRLAEFGALAALLASLTVLANVPLRSLVTRSAIVLPIALGIALFAPLAAVEHASRVAIAEAYSAGWIVIWSVVSKAWLSAYIVLLLSATTAPPKIFTGLAKLGLPVVFVTMLTFLYRYTAILAEQLVALRRSVASRAPNLSGLALVGLYGRLAGNLFVRTYERGERIYSAMLSRGFTGVLPVAEKLRLGPADALAVAMSTLVAFAIVLY